jgi:uncharacterized protein (TIGR03437 family)
VSSRLLKKARRTAKDRPGGLSHNTTSIVCKRSGTGFQACLGLFQQPANPVVHKSKWKFEVKRLAAFWLSILPVLLASFEAKGQSGPSISSIVNGASFAAGPLTPGSLAVVFGTFGIASAVTAQGPPFPDSLGGLSLQLNGIGAPLLYISATQVNFQVPWELEGMSQADLTVTINGQTSSPQSVSLAPFSPAIFSLNSQGSGQGAILNLSQQLVDASNPATPGSTVIEIFATGLGAVSNQPESGAAAPFSPLAMTATSPSVSIAGVSASVSFSGLAPGLTGVYQMNALVPAAAPPGNAVPVAISIGGSTSSTVTIAIAGVGPVPMPSITSLSPAFSATGAASEQVTLTGSNFLPSSTVTFNGAAQAATFVDSNHLTITLPASDLASAGSFPIVVTNAEPAGQAASNTVQFVVGGSGFAVGGAYSVGWGTFAHDSEHTALSLNAPSQPLNRIHWQTPVDLNPQYTGGELLIHYGSPLVTPGNTVIVPVKTGASGGFRVEAHAASDGSLQWMMTTDYVLPPHDWVPEFSPTLTPSLTLYFPGAGGAVYYRDNPDSASGTQGQLAFYGLANYQANPQAYNTSVMISTPIVSDPLGNIYFGFVVTASTPLGLQSGIARISASGQGSWVAAATAASDPSIIEVVQNCAPALNWNSGMLYVAVSSGSTGYLLALNSATLQTMARVALTDPVSGQLASLNDDGTASPFIGPDGDVYYGVLENPLGENHYRGWLLHFDSLLSQKKIPGAFGWDDTPSLVPSFMIPSYTGSSSYLLMTKYNDYANAGGTGLNKIAVLDPNTGETYSVVTATVMKEVLTILGPTPNTSLPGVKEWCINTAAVDPSTNSVLANSEDGKLYRWSLVSNSFTQSVVLTSGIGEAYTPTLIGVDGTVYAINNATLFAIGQ